MSNKYTSVYDWLKYIKANVVGINLRELRLNTCELKVCTTKKPENPSVFLTLPVAHELSVLCMI